MRTVADGSLRCKTCDCDDSCRYRDGLRRTADLVGERLGLRHHAIAWQSAGRTADPWWGPPVDDAIVEAAGAGYAAVVVCSAGFVADHLEVLYDLDLDIEAKSTPMEPACASSGPGCRTPTRRSWTSSRPWSATTSPSAGSRRRRHDPGRGRRRRDRGPDGRLSSAAARPGSVVLEAGDRAGGKLRSVDVGGLRVEAGADAFVARKPWAVDLCRELGVPTIAPGASGSYLWTSHGLRAFPGRAVRDPRRHRAGPAVAWTVAARSPAGRARPADPHTQGRRRGDARRAAACRLR
ncbi:MAG: ferrochelatase [Actinomycetota bacterium]